MDVVSYHVLRRFWGQVALAQDVAGSLDTILDALLAALAQALPSPNTMAIVLIDAGGRPSIRASRGNPDMELILAGALDRGPDPTRPRVLRRAAPAVPADGDGIVDLPRSEAAMLTAPILVDDAVAGFLFADTLLGPEATLTDDVRLSALLADGIGRTVAVASASLSARQDMSRELTFLRSKVSLRFQHIFSTGSSPALDALRGETERASLDRGPVILAGETGTGRSVLARLIHELSPRAVSPLCIVSAPQAPDLEARLFGSAGGGSTPRGPGLLEEADGGSLLIEDAHRLPPGIVSRLVHLVKTGCFSRQGTNRERRVDTRLLLKTLPQGAGPELAAVEPLVVRIPNLRDRREDIPALLQYFFSVNEQRTGQHHSLTHKAQKALETYDWPGNIRELEEVAARLILSATGERIDIADIPPEILADGERPPVLPEDAAELRDMERQQVISALERHGWVQSRAARELGLTLRQIGYRIRKYGLARDEADENQDDDRDDQD